jgi:dTDP-4-dehydrorhamnose reductase
MEITVFGAKGQLGQSLMDISFNYPQHNFLFTDIDTVDIRFQRQIENFVLKNHPNVLINCAAYTAVEKAQNDFKSAMDLNIHAVDNLAKVAAAHDLFLVHISTDYIHDGKYSRTYKETDSAHPLSVYGRTKWKGEVAVRKSHCKSAIIRTSWLYSEYGSNFLKAMLRMVEEGEKEISVVTDQVGSPTYAHDLANAIMQIINEKEKIEQSEIFNYSNEGVASWYDFAVEIMRLGKQKCKIMPIPSSQYHSSVKRPFHTLLDKQKIKDTFDIEIPHWRDALERCMKNMK